MTAEKTPALRGKSMELLKDLTQILQEIIRSGAAAPLVVEIRIFGIRA